VTSTSTREPEPRDRTVREYPDKQYEPFGNVESRNTMQARIEIPALLVALRPPRGGRVLEVGCGRGIALPVLADWLRPEELVGIDIDPVLVEIAKQHACALGLSATVFEADVRAIPFDDASLDLVIDFGTCYHVGGGVAGSRAALGEIARVLKPGGRFIHETPVAQHLAHPVRSFGRRLPWSDVRSLVPERRRVMWTMRRKCPP
jgi:SAM-dependent methyltransferase